MQSDEMVHISSQGSCRVSHTDPRLTGHMLDIYSRRRRAGDAHVAVDHWYKAWGWYPTGEGGGCGWQGCFAEMLRGAYVISPATAWQPFPGIPLGRMNRCGFVCFRSLFGDLTVPFHPSIICSISLFYHRLLVSRVPVPKPSPDLIMTT